MFLRLGIFASVFAAFGAAAPPAASGALIEGELYGQPIRIVADQLRKLVMIDWQASRHVVDLAAKHVLITGGDGTVRERSMAGFADNSRHIGYQLSAWGPGPMVAGHPSVYHVMTREGQACSEVLISGWMKPFLDPAAQALTMLEDLGQTMTAAWDVVQADQCGRPSFAAYASVGWPLMAGTIDRPTFKTTSIKLDYDPLDSEIRPAAKHPATNEGE